MPIVAPRLLLIAPLVMIAGCQQISDVGSRTTTTPAVAATTVGAAVAPAVTAPKPKASARTAAEFDTTSAEQKAEAAKAPASAQKKLGKTIASLGDPTQPGFWIKTPLVKANGQGRIVNPANGKSAKVELVPLSGPASAGSQVSLPALQLIGVSLTDLPEIEVFQN